MFALLAVVAATAAKFTVDAFVGGAMLGATLYTASRTNRVVRHKVK